MDTLITALTYHVFNRRAGRLLDVAKDGYYDTELCLEDFENVNCLLTKHCLASLANPFLLHRGIAQ